MARIRTIKPEFWSSRQIVECSPTARLLFIGLWSFSDDAGHHPADALRLKMEVFPGDPFDEQEIVGWVEELLRMGLVSTYVVDTKEFWSITGWKHQRIDKPTYRHPSPPDSSTPSRPLDEPSPTESSRTESNGVERNGTESNGAERSGAESSRKEPIKKGRSEPEPDRTDHLEIDWEDAAFQAERVAKRVVDRMGEWGKWGQGNRRMLLEAVAIVQLKQLPERWLIEALEGVKLVKKITKRPGALLCTILKNDALETWKKDFTRLRAKITVPIEFVDGGSQT